MKKYWNEKEKKLMTAEEMKEAAKSKQKQEETPVEDTVETSDNDNVMMGEGDTPKKSKK